VLLVAPLMVVPFFFQTYVGVVPPLVMFDVNETVLPAQILVAFALIEIVGVTSGVMVMVIEFEVTNVGEAHEAVDVISTVITSPSTNVVVV
jgi:hypothetical protein